MLGLGAGIQYPSSLSLVKLAIQDLVTTDIDDENVMVTFTSSNAATRNALLSGITQATGAKVNGTFELTVAASVGDVTLTGKLTTASYVYWNSPAYVKYDGSGTVSCTPISNGVAGQSVLSKTLVAPTFDGMRYAAAYPLMWDGQNKIQSLAFNFQDSRIGWKASYAIKWDNAATLSIINIETKDITSKNSLMTQAYAS